MQSNIKLPNKAEGILNAPEAMGRWHFVGCCRSLSLSTISLMIYTTLAVQEKAIKAKIAYEAISNCRSLPANNGATKTKMFFVYCFGRISFIKDNTIFIKILLL